MHEIGVEQGIIKIHIAPPGKGHSPEFWAERAAERIMNVADTAPQPIRDQAYAFQETMKSVILGAIQSAVLERRVKDAVIAETHGQPEISRLIRGDI